ncbi:sigma factor-like helix-turn-helix DNA-binding protein [Embleya sp. NPDC005575]|uniref:sigma factor-like helix-turn-helix DNA-binding protein n=1 Tax=Embleya sp. NPDC005575 TaxID=3156892 RepID=UPI0033B954FB
MRDWIRSAIEELPPKLRVVLMMRHFTGITSYEDIAAACDVPVGTVRSRLDPTRANGAPGEPMGTHPRRHHVPRTRGTPGPCLAGTWRPSRSKGWHMTPRAASCRPTPGNDRRLPRRTHRHPDHARHALDTAERSAEVVRVVAMASPSLNRAEDRPPRRECSAPRKEVRET